MRLALVLLAACTTYAHPSLRNAPANVDLATPLPHEDGRPERTDPGVDPGNEYSDVIVAPFFTGGVGRDTGKDGLIETGIEACYEPSHPGPELMSSSSFGIAAGISIAQWSNRPARLPGPMFAELQYRFTGFVFPMAVGLGPVAYVGDNDLGGQLTYRLFGGVFRFRYLATGGFEFQGGYEIPIPFLFGGSK